MELENELMKVTFGPESIVFRKYPFPGSSVYRDGNFSYESIRDVDPDAKYAEIRTLDGETLFVSDEQRADFLKVIGDKSLAVVARPDIWGLILEPFLDTEFTAAQTEHTLKKLAEFGLSRHEVERTRGEVEAAMLSYNSPIGDWCHLCLFDVLQAVRNTATLTSLKNRILPERFSKFYWDAMKVADLSSRNSSAAKQ